MTLQSGLNRSPAVRVLVAAEQVQGGGDMLEEDAGGRQVTQQASDRPNPAMRNPETDEFPTGPAVGELLPDFTLPDQHGEPVTVGATNGADRSYVAFIRATSW